MTTEYKMGNRTGAALTQPLKRKQLLYVAVQEEIKSYIIQNQLKPGDQLPTEIELARILGVGRNSVREAVKSLETLGVIAARPGTGLYVQDFSFGPLLDHLAYGFLFDLKKLTDVIEVRAHVESSMLDRAIDDSTPEQIRQLRAVLDTMADLAQQGVYSAETDRRFHQVLWGNVNNEVLIRILDIFWVVHNQAQRHNVLSMPTNPMQSYHSHVAIVDALEARDLEALRAAMTRHYAGTKERIVSDDSV